MEVVNCRLCGQDCTRNEIEAFDDVCAACWWDAQPAEEDIADLLGEE